MPKIKNWMLIQSVACVVLLVACFYYPNKLQDQQMNKVVGSADVAKKVAAKQFNLLFSSLQIRNPLDQEFYPISSLSEVDFKLVMESNNVWVLLHDPLSGLKVQARVEKITGLVQFDSVELSIE